MSEHEQTTLYDKLKKWQFLVGIVTGIVGGAASAVIMLVSLSVQYGTSIAEQQEMKRTIASRGILHQSIDTALSNHRAIIYGNVFMRINNQ